VTARHSDLPSYIILDDDKRCGVQRHITDDRKAGGIHGSCQLACAVKKRRPATRRRDGEERYGEVDNYNTGISQKADARSILYPIGVVVCVCDGDDVVVAVIDWLGEPVGVRDCVCVIDWLWV
jgi:hypothetical protein